MAKNNLPKVKGIVKKVLPNTTFRVELEDSREVLAYLCGKMRHFRIKILPGDEVTLELPNKEAEKGRIVYRHG